MLLDSSVLSVILESPSRNRGKCLCARFSLIFVVSLVEFVWYCCEIKVIISYLFVYFSPLYRLLAKILSFAFVRLWHNIFVFSLPIIHAHLLAVFANAKKHAFISASLNCAFNSAGLPRAWILPSTITLTLSQYSA